MSPAHDVPGDAGPRAPIAASSVVHGGVTLADVLKEAPATRLVRPADADVVVRGVRQDSRAVEPGDLFVARRGAAADGQAFVDDALARGAVAVLVEEGRERSDVPCLVAADPRRALAFAAAVVYGHPTFALDVVGITGTNGKTTTAHLVQAAIDGVGGRAGIVGTLGARFEGYAAPSRHTSPEADELARTAAAMLARGASHLVMEVSSIALAAARVEAVRFRVAAFTNLTQDHLDYHGDMAAYAEAKARLFTDLAPGAAAIHVGDPFGAELVRRVAPGGRPRYPLLRFSARPGDPDADVAPIALTTSARGVELRVRTPAGELDLRSPLLGLHNVANLLTALSVGLLLDLPPRDVAAALSRSIPVPGRLERCDDPAADDVIVLVDYAHTPDALERVLQSVRGLGLGRVTCVFGCGGDRDPTKRPLMGAAVARGADRAFVTNDNPRTEDPRAVAAAILPGFDGTTTPFEVELDRRRAIARAVAEAAPGDVVLVAGKGHEPYQILGTEVLPFDDRDEARAALAARRAGRGG